MLKRVWFVLLLGVFPFALAASPLAKIDAWRDKYRIILYEKRIPDIGRFTRIEVRFAPLDKKADLEKLTKECLSLYTAIYSGVWCYGYDNARALDSDLRGVDHGGTPGICWLYRAIRTPTGLTEFERNQEFLLKLNKCPRP